MEPSNRNTTRVTVGTPLCPVDALGRYPAMKSRSRTPLSQQKREQLNTSLLLLDDGNRHRMKDGSNGDDDRNNYGQSYSNSNSNSNNDAKIRGIGTIGTRSASASAVPLITKRPKGPRQPLTTTTTRTRTTYTSEQIASLRHYEQKSKRLSSHEYGSFAERASFRLKPFRGIYGAEESSDSVDVAGSSQPRRVLELESEEEEMTDLRACAQQQQQQQQQQRTRSPVVARKPVGSGHRIAKTSRSTSEPVIGVQARHGEAQEYPDGSPWDTPWLPPSPSGKRGPLAAAVGFGMKNQSTCRLSESWPRLEDRLDARFESGPWPPFSVLLVAQLEEFAVAMDLEKVRFWTVRIAKGMLILYLAACMWSIVAAVRDAVLRALEPVFAFWGIVLWMLGK